MLANNIKLDKFLFLRAHIGHSIKFLNKTMNSFVVGSYQNVAIINNDYLLWSWERLSNLFSHIFFYRLKFFILNTNRNIPNFWLKSIINLQLNYYSNSFLGYIGQNWYGGILSNWNKLWLFLSSSFKKLEKNKKISHKQNLLLSKMINRSNKGITPSFPDFLISLTMDPVLAKEAFLTRILVFGLVDSDKSLDSASISVLSNDDSLYIIEFFFELLESANAQSNRMEQDLFYILIFKKLKKLLIYE